MKTTLVFFLICFCNLLFAKSPTEGVIPDAVEYQVLKDIYNTMGGASWTIKTNWPEVFPETVTNAEFDTWYGVEVTNGDITSLLLNGNNLTNTLTSNIGNLTKLKRLRLHANFISGSIPATVGALTQLEELSLYTNQFSGSIPTEIGNLTNLYTLHLASNQLTGSIPASIGNLTLLQTLELSRNLLEGEIPNTIGNLSALVTLDLHQNSLDGQIPSSIGNLANLEILSLYQNQLTGIPATISGLVKVRHFLAQNNLLSGTMPSQFNALTQLEYLSLYNNQLSGAIPSLENLDELEILDLSKNNFTSLPSTIGGLNSLTLLFVNQNSITGAIPSSIENLTNLQKLYLHQNQLTSLPAEIGNLINLTELLFAQNNGTFSDILPVKAVYNGTFTYSPQALIDQMKNVQGAVGNPLTLIATIDRTTNPLSVYQWFKKISGVSTALNSASTEGHTVTIANIQQSDANTQYYYTISNPLASALTLTSNLQTLELIQCNDSISVDFQIEVLNGTHTFTPAFDGGSCTPSYHWDFGDGTTSTEQAATHSYTTTGTFTVTLTVNYTCAPCPGGQITSSHDVMIENSFCGSIYCDGAGNVGIGTQQTNGFRLSVNGKIRANDIIKVYPQNQWSDFVFEKDYKLLPLSEVEKFIKKNGHLPQIPSAKEVETDGIDLGGMDAKLLQKVEELTLYMIELKKENEALKKRIQNLESKNKK